jgi:hypothetical protein
MTQTDTPPTKPSDLDARARRVARVFPRARQRSASPGPKEEPARRVLPVLVPVIVAGIVVTAGAVWSFGTSSPSVDTLAGLLALLLAAVVAEAFPLPIERVPVGRTSLATVFIVAAATIYGWAAATLVAFLTMALVELGRRRPPSRVSYNVALYALSAAAAGGAASLVDGSGLGSLALGTLLAACAFYFVDVGLLAAVVSRATGEPVLQFLRGVVAWTAIPLAVMASLTIILVVLWDQSPFLAVAPSGRSSQSTSTSAGCTGP